MCENIKDCECGCIKKVSLFTKDTQKLESYKFTDEGYLVADVVLARTGIQEYRAFEIGLDSDEPNKIIRVYRSPEEVFNEFSMKSFEGKPVTNNHPPELVTIDNIKQYQVGHVDKEVKKVDNLLKSEIVVTDKNTINAIINGKNEISNGYVADYDFTPGISNDGEYDAIQVGIIGNHIAIVDEGRCGEECKIVLDNKKGAEQMARKKFVTVRDEMMEVPEGAEDIVEALKKENEMLKAKLSELESLLAARDEDLKKMQDEMEAYKDNMQYQEENKDGEIEELAEKRLEVTDTARKVIPSFDCKGKKLLDIKKAIVAAKRGNLQLDSKSEDYINGMFDMIHLETKNQGSSDLSRYIGDGLRSTFDGKPAMSARDQMIANNNNAWRSK